MKNSSKLRECKSNDVVQLRCALQLLEQIKALEQAISQQSGEREELIGQLDKFAEDQTSASQTTETMVGKIQVRGG